MSGTKGAHSNPLNVVTEAPMAVQAGVRPICDKSDVTKEIIEAYRAPHVQ